MPNGITRRDFLRYAAAAAGSLWLASLTSSLAPSARGASPQQVVAPAPSFQALPAPTLLGAPVDVGIGGDGVQWVLGESGAPSSYDPLQQTWLPFGGGIDAAAYIPFVDSNENFSVALCYFRGGEVYKSGAAGPMSIASLWPNLPPSFQQGVDGATYLNDKDGNTFLLFRQGQIAAVNVWGQVSVGLLTEYGGMGWPSGAWQDGLFDYVISGKDPAFSGYAIFVRGGEYIVANLAQAIITTAPQPLSAGFGGAAAMLLAQDDIQAVVCTGAVLATGAPLHVFSGPVVYTLENSTATAPPQAQYLGEAIAGWPAAWHPMLQAAPAGSVGCAASPGNLWSLDRAGTPLWNAGSGWTPMPLPGNTPAGSLDVGADGSVFAVAANSLYSLAAGAWGATSLPTGTLAQVSVGDASHVWVRDVQGYVFRAAGGTVRPANLGVAVTDMQANTDGTLWHCSAGLGSAYRYISEGQQSSEALAIGLDVTSVLKTASSGFGTGFFLAQQGGQSALIRYTSPYLFKTSGQYSMAGQQQIAAGAASIFLFCETPAVGGGWDFFVVALDVQTGAERWRYAYPSSREASGYTPLYDAQHQLVYVFQAIGVVQALDAQTGTLRWTLALPPAAAGQPAIPTQPVLYDGMIYTAAYDNPALAPNSSTVYLIAVDTRDAAQRAANNQPVVARWTYSYNVPGQQVAPLPPVVFEGSVYGAVWSLANQQLQLSLLQVEVLTGLGSDLFDASIFGSGPNNGGSSAPIIGRLTTDPSNTVGSLIINAGTAGIYGIFLDGSETIYHYSPQALEGAPVSTNLVIFDGAVYFCDSSGNLYGLDASLNPLPGLPTTFIGSALNFTGITVAGDENGQAVVIAGDTSNNTLCFYSTATGNLLTLATNQTAITALSDVTHDGIVYVGGTTVNSLGQVFAIRTSEVGALRDFVVESQLMQDYDIGAVTTARYQTHVTVVDGSKTPLPFTGVKIWADSALSVQVDGQPYAIGPDTPLATQVDAAGSLTIVSDATDLFATPLRVWAAFMDPFERIVVFPDQEFHARLPSMTADAGNDDPTVINLATGTNYAGTKIFTNQQEAQAVAQAVGAACKASGIGGSGSASAGAPAGAPALPYVAYDDLPGMRYLAHNTPASRPAAPQSAYGLSWSQGAAGPSVLTQGQAATAIDALDGTPVTQLSAGLGGWFHSFWNGVRSGAIVITDCIVSIGKLVYMGVQYIENQVKKVFREVVHNIEDLADSIAIFFVSLGKALEDVIELLSLLLHFEEVVVTHTIIKAALLAQVDALAGNITQNGLPAVDTFLGQGEEAIAKLFCKVKQQVDPSVTCASTKAAASAASPPISSFNGTGATAHTVFRVAPKGGGTPTSHTVYATWGFHKVKSHYQQAAAGAPGAGSPGDPITDFFTSFAASLASNTALQQSFNQTKSDFAATFKVQSTDQFLQMAIVDLLDILQDLLLGSIAVTKAFLDGLLALAADMVAFLFDPTTGLLTRPLGIPVLSDLYRLLFGSELTFLDLIILVAAIPVTFLYRIIEGAWPSQQASSGAQAALTPLARVMGLMNGALYFGRLVFMPIADAASIAGSPNLILFKILTGIGVGLQISAILTGSGTPLSNPAGWTVFLAGFGLVFAPFFGPVVAPALSSILALARLGAYIAQKADPAIDSSWLAFSGDVMGVLPPFSQPVKYLAETFPLTATAVMVGIDVIGNYAAAAAAIANTALNWGAVPTDLPQREEPPTLPGRIFMPFAAGGAG